MILDETWQEGLSQIEQSLVVEFFLAGGSFTVDVWKNAGYKSARTAKNALQKEKLRRAVKLFSAMQLELKADFVKAKAAGILVVRAFYNSFDIITADGKLRPEWTEKPKSMGELAHCVDGIETSYDKMGRKQVKIKLANKHEAITGLNRLFNFDNQDEEEEEEAGGKKPIHLLTDEGRRREIAEYIKRFEQKRIECKKKKGKGK